MSDLAEIQEYTGRGNELISFYIQPSKSVSNMIGIIEQEIESLDDYDENKRMKYSVQKSLDAIKSELLAIDEMPENGLVIFAGRVNGDTQLHKFSEELENPVRDTKYITGRQFSTEELDKITSQDTSSILVLIEIGKCVIGRLNNNSPEVLTEIEINVPSKHSKGGQSQARFERRRREVKEEFFRNCGKKIKAYLSEKKESDVYIGGPEITVKEFLNQTDIKDNDVINFSSIQYVNTSGLRRLSRLATKHKQEEKDKQQAETLENFFENIKREDTPTVYGRDGVKEAIEYKAVKKLIIHSQADYNQLVQKAEDQGAELITLTGGSENEEIFKDSFGGIGATLNYEISSSN